MRTYGFTVILKCVPFLNDEIPDRLFEAGCDDSSPFSAGGETGAAFDREGESLEAAIISAVADIRRAGYEVQRVTIDDAKLVELSGAAS